VARRLLDDAIAQIALPGAPIARTRFRHSLQWNGGAEDTASGDDLVFEMSDTYRSAGS